jgi:hypothetical protein
MAVPLPSEQVKQWCDAMGLSADNRTARRRVAEAARFYANHMEIHDPDCIASHLHGIDFRAPVRQIKLPAGREVVAFRSVARAWGKLDLLGCYFTDPGTDQQSVGIRPEEAARCVRYVVKRPATALRSKAKTGFVPEKGHVNGGAIQYCIPHASKHLVVAEVKPAQDKTTEE